MSTTETKLQHTSDTIKTFTLESLQTITNNFSEEHKIGGGGYGNVYKRMLDNGEEIALKKLHYMPGLDDKVLINEFNNLMKARHKNITRLVGYCYHTGYQMVEHKGLQVFALVEERVLCIEYLQNGSLDKYLSEETCGLDWHIRYKIINGVCEGLNYLHNGYKDPIYHMDLKPANILLDKDMTPKIGDFGLSRLFPPEHTFFTQKMIGTPGYMPPEYIEKHEITSKFDVFSLGVIIIRIIAGDEGYSKGANISSEEFVEHVGKKLCIIREQYQILQCMHADHGRMVSFLFLQVHENWRKRLGKRMSSHTSEEVITFLKIALKCVEVDRVRRPTISEIIIELNKVDTIKSSTISVEMLDVNAGVQLTRTSNTNELPAMNAIMGAVSVGGDNSHGNSLPIGQLANEIVVEVPATNSKSDARSADGGVAGNFNLTNLGPSVALGGSRICMTSSKISTSPWDEEENRLQQMPKKTSMEASSLSYSNLQTRARPRLGYDFLAKIIIIGESCVGKSQLLSRFAGGSFTTSFITTIGIDFRIRTIELDEKWIKLQVWDTSGHERFRTVTNTYYGGAMGILLVYDVTDESSFNNIRNWKRDIEQHAAPDVTQILVGNKAEMDETKRAVTTSRGQVLADEYGIKFFETSAKTGLNIDQVFISLAREIIQRLAAKTDGIPKDPVAEIKRRHRGPLAFARELFSKKKEG